MKLNDVARDLIGQGADATLVTLNPDGSPQVSLVWVALQSTPDGDELVTAHLSELRNEQFKLRMQKGSGQLTQTHQLKRVRREIAQVNTLLGAKK